METRIIAGMAEAYYASLALITLGAHFSGRRHPGRRLRAQLPLSGTSPRRRLPQATLQGRSRLRESANRPGLGIELDEEAMQDKLGHDWRNPEPYDSRDGSVVDW